MTKVRQLSSAAELDEALASSSPVLLDFTAEWCGPCQALKPVLETLAGEYAGQLDIVAIDADAHADLTARYGVLGLPTLVLSEGGEELMRMTGSISGAALKKRLAPFI